MKFFHRKPEIGKITKNLLETPILTWTPYVV